MHRGSPSGCRHKGAQAVFRFARLELRVAVGPINRWPIEPPFGPTVPACRQPANRSPTVNPRPEGAFLNTLCVLLPVYNAHHNSGIAASATSWNCWAS